MPARLLPWTSLCLALLVLTGCASAPSSNQVPFITDRPTNKTRLGAVIWSDLLSTNVEAVKPFYAGLLDWQFSKLQPDSRYTVINYGARPMSGILDISDDPELGKVSRWLPAISTNLPDDVAEQAVTGGGRVYVAPTRLSGRGRIAVLGDTQGGMFSLVHSLDGDPRRRTPDYNEILWHELWTADTDAAARYYGLLFGFTANPLNRGQSSYRVFRHFGLPRAGLVARGQGPANWVMLVRVADLAELLAKVEPLGGKVLQSEESAERGGPFALIEDPAGAQLALLQWQPGGSQVEQKTPPR